MQSILGILVFIAIAWGFSEQRNKVKVKTIIVGLGLQFIIAFLLLNIPWLKQFFLVLNKLVLILLEATTQGTRFVFGYLGGAAPPFLSNDSGSSFIMAFQALPLILIVSALSAVLFYWRVLPLLVGLFSHLLQKTMGLSGSISLACAVNIFIGMVEAPLIIREYLLQLSRSELFILMTTGMATIAGTVMVLYAAILAPIIPDVLGHIMIASIISAPAAILIAQIMVPEKTKVNNKQVIKIVIQDKSTMDALTRGTVEGVKLLINIIAMLIVLIAMVSLINQILALIPGFGQTLSLQLLLGYLLAPIAWLLGIPWSEAVAAGSLLGTKIILNEFLAFIQLAQQPKETLSEPSKLILTYALCGFANFGSLGIMIAGISTMVPQRRNEIIELSLRSIVSGNLATFMTAAIIALII
ncbi:MAG: nucleoside transporter C-terminal domain-containing protein [Pseudomonadota bacterium]